jgi:WD repeat-containing protein 48
MIKRDEAYRAELNENARKAARAAAVPSAITIPPSPMTNWDQHSASTTPRGNGNSFYPMTPGMGIGVATPSIATHLPVVAEDGAPLNKPESQVSRTSAEKPDYFGNASINSDPANKPADKPAAAPAENQEVPKSPVIDADKENGKDSSTLFGKKFRMGMSFGSKKLGRSASTNIDKPIVTDDKEKAADEGSESSESGEKGPEKEKEVEDNLYGIVQKIRNEYERLLTENPTQEVESGITPSLPNETPVLKVPGGTTVIIQEETSGGVKDLYRGSVETVGEDADVIGERAPMWLGDLLLRVRLLPFRLSIPLHKSLVSLPSS